MRTKKLEVRPPLIRNIGEAHDAMRKALFGIEGKTYKNKDELCDLLRVIRSAGHSINQVAQKAITEIGEV